MDICQLSATELGAPLRRGLAGRPNVQVGTERRRTMTDTPPRGISDLRELFRTSQTAVEAVLTRHGTLVGPPPPLAPMAFKMT
jgi:hypothetical protein